MEAKEVRLMNQWENGRIVAVVAEDKTAVRNSEQGFWAGVWRVLSGEAPAAFFFKLDGKEPIWGNSPAEVFKAAREVAA